MKLYLANRNRHTRGQSLIVAVIVMFVLLFIGGIFVGLVARNLLNAGRARDTLSAQQFAEAGIKQAQNYLLYSPDGADWRPAPTPPINANDPDKQWLDAGYSRIDLGRGRALIRITYQPGVVTDPDNPLQTILDPNSKYLKVESVGRNGFLDRNDPTTFLNTPAPRLRREYLGYMQLGLTDYTRFVTNKNGDNKAVSYVGPGQVNVPLSMQMGKLPLRTFGGGPAVTIQPGAPMRFNTDVVLGSNLIIAEDRRNSEALFSNGKIISRGPTTVFLDPETNITTQILSSDDLGFLTFGSRIRDAAPVPDATGRARSIPTLAPPDITLADLASGVTRYRMLTRDSGRWLGPVGTSFNTGRVGFGAGLYISNFGNTERETTSVGGGQSMRNLWLNKGGSSYWNGHFYIGPGTIIEFGYQIVQDRDTNGALRPGIFSPHPGFRVVRDVAGGDRPFQDPNGNIAPAEMKFTFFIYKPSGRKPVVKLENDFFRSYLISSGLAATEQDVDRFLPEFNGVIYAEGNVRTKGLLCSKQSPIKVANPALDGFEMPIRVESGDPDMQSPLSLTLDQIRDIANPPAITLVSGANIYIEGNLIREGYTQVTGPKLTMPGTLISLLAQEYVCVNTTMFVAPNKILDPEADYRDQQSPWHYQIGTDEASSTPPFALQFSFGDDPTAYTYGRRDTDPAGPPGPPPINMLVRHGTAGQTFEEFFINSPFTANPGDSLYLFNNNPPPYDTLNPPPFAHVISPPISNFQFNSPWQFEQKAFQLQPYPPAGGKYTLFTVPGITNMIQPAVDPNFTSSAGIQDLLAGRLAIAPMDIRIEAVMYAQNESFFIIPGYSCNPIAADTRDNALRQGSQAGLPQGEMVRPAGIDGFHPFYGEPFDCRITIVGTICENRSASEADQTAWSQLWGWIPEIQGSMGRSIDPVTNTLSTEILVPNQHLRLSDVGTTVPNVDPRTAGEKQGLVVNVLDRTGQTITASFGITRGLRYMYDPALPMPYPNYSPPPAGSIQDVVSRDNNGNVLWAWQANGAYRQDDFGRFLPPMPKLPVCPNFVFYGEVR